MGSRCGWAGKPEPYLTAFALWGLKLASDAGHKLPPGMIDRGTQLPARRSWDATRPSRAACTASWARWGAAPSRCTCWRCCRSPDPGYANKLLEKKAELPRFGEAFLARALALNLGAQHPAVTGLLDDAGRAPPSRTGRHALIREPGSDTLHWYMSDDVRTTAIATDAFLDLRPSEPMLPRAGQGTVRRSASNGRWQTTQDNLYVAGRADALREVAADSAT